MSDTAVFVKGHISEKDYVRSQWLAMKPRPFRAALGIGVLVLIAAVSAIHVVGYIRGTSSSSDATMGPFLLVLVTFFFFVVLPWQFKRSYRKYPAIHEPVNMRWNDDGLSVDSDIAKVDVPWRMFIKYRENKHVFLVYQSPQLFHMVPKRLLRDDDNKKLKGFLKQHVGKAS